jgi:adenine-specific DNA methylase
MWLSNKPARRVAMRWLKGNDGKLKTETVRVEYSDGSVHTVHRPLFEVFQPKSPNEVEKGTSKGGAATCPVTGYTTSVERVREQLILRSGGAADARLLCVVTTPKGVSGKTYRVPNARDNSAAEAARSEIEARKNRDRGEIPLLPEGKLNHLRGFFNVVLYGMTTWGDLFSPSSRSQGGKPENKGSPRASGAKSSISGAMHFVRPLVF